MVGNFPNDIGTEKICDNIFRKRNWKNFLNEMWIPSGPDWNESLNIARHLQQISEVILIDSNEEEGTYGNKGVDIDWI